jgi:chromosome segregation and condensation protein ScpB
MTGWRKRTIMELAREVKMPYDFVTGEPINLKKLEAFAELVRADEREACAKVCDHMAVRYEDMRGAALESAAESIRLRGQV